MYTHHLKALTISVAKKPRELPRSFPDLTRSFSSGRKYTGFSDVLAVFLQILCTHTRTGVELYPIPEERTMNRNTCTLIVELQSTRQEYIKNPLTSYWMKIDMRRRHKSKKKTLSAPIGVLLLQPLPAVDVLLVVLFCYLFLSISRTFNMQIFLSAKSFFVCCFNDAFYD